MLSPSRNITSTGRHFLSMLLMFLALTSQAQLLRGKITDTDNRQPIPFAVVIIDNTNKGTTADLDGAFDLIIPAGATQIKIQIIGYSKLTIQLADLDFQKVNTIRMKRDGIALGEIIVTPAENPAIPIIRKVIENKPKFNINNLPYYICTTYAKTWFNFSDKNGDEAKVALDSMSNEEKKLLENSYLFFMESVTEKKYRYKDISQEKVTASRVSGFKSAPFGAFASQLQSFTFYADNIELLGQTYLSPITKGTFRRYNFEIADTVLNGNDTTLLINFYPKKYNKFRALKGVLYINKNQYVLANVLAEPSEIASDGTNVKIQQLYERVDSTHWFPKQVNTEILFNGITGATAPKEGSSTPILKGTSRLYVRDIVLDTTFKIKNKNVATYNAEGFDQKKEDYWVKYRQDSLNEKEKKTYRVIDSVGKKVNLDRKLIWFNALSTGKLQLGYFNLDLKYLFRVNDYEGFRLGAGISTSNKLSRWFSVGGYTGYGFSDKAFKYGGHLRVNLNYRQSTYLLAEAARDVVETAGTFFLEETKGFISTANTRQVLINKMDKISFAKVSFNTPIFNSIKTSFFFSVQQRQSPFGYAQPQDNLLLNETRNFTLNEAGISFRYWPKEKFTESMGQLISLGSKWPIFSVNIIKGLTTEVYGYAGDFDYTKIDLRIDQQFNFKVKGFISYQIQAGKVFGNVPYSIQYNNKSSRTDRYRLSVEKSFETMYLNEFISTQYAALFFSINSGKFLRPNKYCNPEVELVHNYGIGSLDNRAYLTNIELNDISKGYTEAGLRLKNIYKAGFSTFGAGVFYRYGNYAIGEFEKDLTYKLVLGMSF